MHAEFLMGNEAIALGALAAGVQVVAGYLLRLLYQFKQLPLHFRGIGLLFAQVPQVLHRRLRGSGWPRRPFFARHIAFMLL